MVHGLGPTFWNLSLSCCALSPLPSRLRAYLGWPPNPFWHRFRLSSKFWLDWGNWGLWFAEVLEEVEKEGRWLLPEMKQVRKFERLVENVTITEGIDVDVSISSSADDTIFDVMWFSNHNLSSSILEQWIYPVREGVIVMYLNKIRVAIWCNSNESKSDQIHSTIIQYVQPLNVFVQQPSSLLHPTCKFRLSIDMGQSTREAIGACFLMFL